MTRDEMLSILQTPEDLAEQSFSVASALARMWATEEESKAQEMLLRALEVRGSFGAAMPILNALVRQAGLYPYLDPEGMETRDQIAYEFHRPEGFGEGNIVFHRVQGIVYRNLMAGHNVILSAPTSFGKSLIIDAVVASERHKNIVVVVPTIALIDETRRRLSRFRERYKIITHPSQTLADRNVLVFTQERVVENLPVQNVDFFVIDEFYKLNPTMGDERTTTLNHALYKLLKTGAQFYMLGPNVEEVSSQTKNVQFKYIQTDYRTVVSEVTRILGRRADHEEQLITLCRKLSEPTLIFCSSPARVRRVVKALINNDVSAPTTGVDEAVNWISDHYHSEWLFPVALKAGIAYHHGRLPRALSELAVHMFNEDRLRFLICTSTLIEGVNTKAKNVIVFDNKIARTKFDFFTFNNIVGRSGRMFQHFIGHAYLFHEPPQEELPFVDIPAISQSKEAPDSLLVQMESSDLTKESRERIADILEQEELSLEVIRENHGIDPRKQIELARYLRENADILQPQLLWTGRPNSYDQFDQACDLIHRFFVGTNRRIHGVSSGKQLTYLMWRFMTARSVRQAIRTELEKETVDSADEAVERVLDFTRYWASYTFPNYLRALNTIQEAVFTDLELPAGNYQYLASQIENHFLDPAIYALDEYGIPFEIGERLQPWLQPQGNIDVAIDRLKELDLERIQLSRFEKDLVADARRYM